MATEPKQLTDRQRDIIRVALKTQAKVYERQKNQNAHNTLMSDTYEKMKKDVEDVERSL